MFVINFNTAKSQEAVLSGNSFPIGEDMFGYNSNTWNSGPKWDVDEFRHAVGRLFPGIIRYPGGTISNYWDWRTGNVMKTITKGYPKYYHDENSYTPFDYVNGNPVGTEVVYCICKKTY